MRLEYDEAIDYLSQRTYNNTRDRLQKNRQRRNQVTDLYGVEYTRQGDATYPATFYISISPDMVYLERFQFKLIIAPFLSTIGSGTNAVTVTATGDVKNTNLSIANNQISPNPHKHDVTVTTDPHTHTLVQGITPSTTTATDFAVTVAGIDITAYLMAQWGEIEGQGVWPSLEIEENYDILEVASMLMAENKEDEAKALTSSGYKEIAISANGPFQVTLVLYAKYSHLNR